MCSAEVATQWATVGTRSFNDHPLLEHAMTTAHELESKLWKALKTDRTVMLGMDGAENGHTRPMTAQFEDDRSPIWFFAGRDNTFVKSLTPGQRAIAAFASKSHDLFASISGTLREDTDRAVIDRLWNPFVAAWYEGGKDDPNLVLLRLDASEAQVWLNENNLLAGVKMLLGADPKKDYADKVAQVDLR